MITARNHRFDIQVMRGVAVLAVVLFHAFPGLFGAGFLGVDVFFVVSGFLITGPILRALERGDFSFRGFYIRRAKRLLPASLTTLAVTSALAAALLTRSQMADYAEQVLGSLAFVANVVLANQTGYFEGAAETKPLLHIWSLSLEEQFYFLAPFLLWLTPLRLRPWLLVSAMVASFALCLVLVSAPAWLPFSAKGAQKLAFFILFPRAWELLFGALCAWVMIRRPELTVSRWVKRAALAVILATCAIGFDPVHPRLDALLVVLATGVVLLGRDDWITFKALAPVKIVGDWSYSLYLVHWPLFSFAYIASVGHPSALLMAGLGGVSFVLAWLQYRYVERPYQDGKPWFGVGWPWATALMAGAIATFAVPALGVTGGPSQSLAPNTGLAMACDQPSGRWVDLPECRTSDAPTVAVWGDSYAMHWIAGLDGLPLVQMTKSACAPVAGLAHTSDRYSASWSRECVAFNDSAMAAIEAMPSVRYVLLSSPFGQVFSDDGQALYYDGKTHPFSRAGIDAFTATLERLQAAGKVPIILAPTPRAPFDAGLCNERLIEGRPIIGQAQCVVPREASDVVATLDQISEATGVAVLDPADALCDASGCITRAGSQILYRDNGHMTPAGARYVLERLGLAGRLAPVTVTKRH